MRLDKKEKKNQKTKEQNQPATQKLQRFLRNETTII